MLYSRDCCRVLPAVAILCCSSAGAFADLPAEILADSPVAYWRLDDVASPAADSSGNPFPNDADAFNQVTFGEPSLFLNDDNAATATAGNGQLITFPFEKMDGGGFTVEFWVKVNALPAGFANLIGDGEGGLDFNLMVYLTAGGLVRAHVQTDGGFASIDTVEPVVPGAVHHVVSTWDAASGELILYLDGEPAATNTSAGFVPTLGLPVNTGNQIYIGQDAREARAPDATFDEVAIYNYALPADRIAAHFNAVEVPDDPDPPDPPEFFTVPVGSSSLIGELDYSDSFTIGAGAPDLARQNYSAQTFPLPAGVEVVEDSHGNAPPSWPSDAWSIATDTAVNPGTFGYPGPSGGGSETGMTQRGGGGDWAIPYGLREVFVVQSDFVQLPDRVDFTVGSTPGNIFTFGNLSIFFRQTGHPSFPEIGIFDGALETDTGLTSGIAASRLWQNYALKVDVPNETIEVFVNEQSRGVIDLLTFDGGFYAGILNNAFVGIGGAGADRLWSDNFQVGAPGTVPPAAPPVLTEVGFDAGDLTLTWQSRPATDYKVEISFDLTTWLELANPIASGGETTTFMQDLTPVLPPGQQEAFFRVTDNQL